MNDLVKDAFMIGVGWMYAYACNSLDNGEDLRKTEVPEIIKQALEDYDSARH